jgi:hypothetical protein
VRNEHKRSDPKWKRNGVKSERGGGISTNHAGWREKRDHHDADDKVLRHKANNVLLANVTLVCEFTLCRAHGE